MIEELSTGRKPITAKEVVDNIILKHFQSDNEREAFKALRRLAEYARGV
jgi:hypothetical protein